MLSRLDALLNRITMYRLVYFVLIGWVTSTILFGFIGLLPFSGWQIIGSGLYLLTACWLLNRIFAWLWHAPAHDDSAYITALILTLIITPFRRETDAPLLILAPIIAMSAKYLLAWRRQHIFNPAALAMVVTGLTISKSASWWVGTEVMFGPVLIGGYLVIRKIRRLDAVRSFLVTAIGSTIVYGLLFGSSLDAILRQQFLSSPLLFFASIMLIEPATMPPTRRWRLAYGGLIGLLTAPFVHSGTFYFTPELALVSGNLLGWIITRRERYVLTLRSREDLAPSIIEFVFDSPRLPKFRPGQYLEWSLAHYHPDGRGVRRYFTIASSPTETDLRLGIKKYSPMSSYKQSLLKLQPGQKIVAEQIDGDFVLPSDTNQPLVFIAGGIGVTPFRSMLKYLIDRNEVRPITLFHAIQTTDDIVYAEIIRTAETKLGMKTVYVISDKDKAPADWHGQTGYITGDMIQQEVPNHAQAVFYLSGPQAMVATYVKILGSLGIKRKKIMTDYFPGFA